MRFVVLALTAAALAPTGAWAGPREDVADGVTRCSRIADDRQWLDCFYGAAQPMRAKLGLTPAPEAQQMLSRAATPALAMAMAPAAVRPAPPVAPPPPAGAAAAQDFGKPVRSDHVDRETGRIAAFTFDKYGIFTVTLTNGQVWQQNASDSTKAQWHASPTQSVYNVDISEGLFGSYTLKVLNMPGAYKVKRIK